MIKNQKVYILIGVHNNLSSTKILLESLNEQSISNYKIIIIDDGSKDQTKKYIQKNYPQIIILKGNGKLWWTGSLKLGVEYVLSIARIDDFIITINNDCKVDKFFIENLLNTSLINKRAIVGSMIIDLYDKNKIIDAGVKINWIKGKFVPIKINKRDALNKKINIREVDVLSTKGTIFPIEVFKKVGNFDNRHFPHYISDYEFSYRAKKNGFKLFISYNSIVYNDYKITGFGESIPDKLTIKDIQYLLFHRKSRINIVDNFWFIALCCSNKFKIINYLRLLIKSFLLFSYLSPLYKFKKIIYK